MTVASLQAAADLHILDLSCPQLPLLLVNGLLGGITHNLNPDGSEHGSVCPSQAMAAIHSMSKLHREAPREAQVGDLGDEQCSLSPLCSSGLTSP